MTALIGRSRAPSIALQGDENVIGSAVGELKAADLPGTDCPYASYCDKECPRHVKRSAAHGVEGLGVTSPDVFDVPLTELPVDDPLTPHRPAAAGELWTNVVQLGLGDS
jgi:hypothetical protein